MINYWHKIIFTCFRCGSKIVVPNSVNRSGSLNRKHQVHRMTQRIKDNNPMSSQKLMVLLNQHRILWAQPRISNLVHQTPVYQQHQTPILVYLPINHPMGMWNQWMEMVRWILNNSILYSQHEWKERSVVNHLGRTAFVTVQCNVC